MKLSYVLIAALGLSATQAISLSGEPFDEEAVEEYDIPNEEELQVEEQVEEYDIPEEDLLVETEVTGAGTDPNQDAEEVQDDEEVQENEKEDFDFGDALKKVKNGIHKITA